MNQAFLKRYEQAEGDFVVSKSQTAISRGYLQTWRDLYPEITAPPHRAYSRFPVPLPLLLLMYDQTAVYVPPADASTLQARWGLSMHDFRQLAEAGLVQPLIAHPSDYAAPHFDQMFELRPPSVWARGLAMLFAMNLGDTLSVEACPLPVKAMVQLPAARSRFHKLHPTDSTSELTLRIERDILTNYADLWICGEGTVADELAQLEDPARIFGALLTLNEVRTYPLLFGLNGTANYAAAEIDEEAALVRPYARSQLQGSMFRIPAGLPILLGGLGIDIAALNANLIIDFHASGDAQRLRAAVDYFERTARSTDVSDDVLDDDIVQAADALQHRLRDAARELALPAMRGTMDRTERTVRYVIQAGLPAIGAAIGFLAGDIPGAAMGLGAASYLEGKVLPNTARESAADAVLAKRFSPGLANLWRIKKHR
jgi:hypothetical protein